VQLPGDSEFTFELLVCAWAERHWRPAGDATPVVVARQLGTRQRRWDTVVVEVDPAAFAARRQLDDRGLDSDLLHVVRNAPAEWTWYRDALPDPGYPWRYVRAAVHRAAARGVVEERKRNNRVELRRVAPYPDWVERIVAVENKPDLDAAAARQLADQLAHDVQAGLADEVWVATAATDADVEPALLRETPVEAGLLTLDCSPAARPSSGEARTTPTSPPSEDATTVTATTAAPTPATSLVGEVVWYPGHLEVDDERGSKRLALAERAYGRGWRSYLDSVRPDCRWFQLRSTGEATVPYCSSKGRCQSSAECSGSCPAFEPEPPAWRTRGWPIEGGPGKGIRRLLDRQRRRHHDRIAGSRSVR
jgi:hypothetical protein